VIPLTRAISQRIRRCAIQVDGYFTLLSNEIEIDISVSRQSRSYALLRVDF